MQIPPTKVLRVVYNILISADMRKRFYDEAGEQRYIVFAHLFAVCRRRQYLGSLFSSASRNVLFNRSEERRVGKECYS